MTELFEFAKTTKEIKEQIRTAINARGIEVDESIPFSVYPQKIKEIARDPAFNARNDLGVTEIEAGTKVLIQPLEQQSGLVVKFFNALQKANWGSLCLYPYTTTRLMCDTARYYGGCGMFSWTEEQGLEEIFATTTGVEDYGNDMSIQGLKFLSHNLVTRYNCNSIQSPYSQDFWTPDNVLVGTSDEHIYNDGYGIKKVYDSAWTLWKVNENGEFTEQIGQDTYGEGIGRNCNDIYVSPDGQYVVRIGGYNYDCRLWKNDGGAMIQVSRSITDLSTIISAKDYRNILGGTYDGKYMIVNRFNNTADDRGIRNFPTIIEMDNENQIYTEYTDLDITGLPTWYPWLQTLCVKNAQGVVRMFKYADGKWEEISVDFPDTFTSGCDNRVTLNYDGSQICVTDSSNYQTGTVYLYNLEVTANGYKAVPYTPHNFNTKSYTAYATGNITEETVEVNALLPTLDNMEYDNSIEVHPIVKPSVQPDIVIPE
jgi:hypothetical protein